MSYIELNSENFDHEVRNEADMPVLVDFFATWCQPCMMLSPVIEEIADELDGDVKVCKLDCDEAGDIAMEFAVMSIPCIVLFDKGTEKNRLVGLHSKDDILDFIKNNR